MDDLELLEELEDVIDLRLALARLRSWRDSESAPLDDALGQLGL